MKEENINECPQIDFKLSTILRFNIYINIF